MKYGDFLGSWLQAPENQHGFLGLNSSWKTQWTCQVSKRPDEYPGLVYPVCLSLPTLLSQPHIAM